MTPVPIPPETASMWKEDLEWHFRSFCRSGHFKPETLWDDVAHKRRQLWVVLDKGQAAAAVLTSVADDLTQTVIVTHAAGREMAAWQHLWTYLEDWARGIGSKRIEAICRPGWERTLKGHGLRKTHVTMEKRL